MGDGEVVTCEGPGTPYEDRFGVRASPDCGYEFSEQGDYTVTARSYWTVAWEGVGQSGSIPMTFERETQIRVGELQVLTR
ncbi:hypothetical protein [Myceligenerans indicum]|uniref:Uncharacterized protein n=1 Tax=Myceligenerans indicum TaxID=2593663 RepID=A0ABS1LF36_9MICO|nr:hypothetical protein [Myceligenerans indicum]MBL0884851.1 hypothetical protein [Myceligenerans indicum]